MKKVIPNIVPSIKIWILFLVGSFRQKPQSFSERIPRRCRDWTFHGLWIRLQVKSITKTNPKYIYFFVCDPCHLLASSKFLLLLSYQIIWCNTSQTALSVDKTRTTRPSQDLSVVNLTKMLEAIQERTRDNGTLNPKMAGSVTVTFLPL